MISLGFRVAGEYKCTVLHKDGTRSSTGWMKNIVTNFGLDLLGSRSAAPIGFCRVGTGTSTPVATQTALDTQVAFTSTQAITSTNEGSPNYSTRVEVTYTFPLGGVVATLAELGIGTASSGATLFSRALILDGGGSPTTISVLATDQLLITYRLRIFPVLTDLTSSVNLSATSYAYVGRVANVSGAVSTSILQSGSLDLSDLNTSATIRNTGATLGAVTGAPSGGTALATTLSVAKAAYTAGNYYRDVTITVGPPQGNLAGGIVTLQVNGAFAQSYQYSFSPAIPKTATETLVFGMRISWARV